MEGERRQYEVRAPVGTGGFGTVYEARLLGEGGFAKRVALKVLRADLEGAEEVASRLRDEARILGLIRHRAVVNVDGLVQLDGRWTVVMEFIDGLDLNKVMKSHGRLPPSVALAVIGELAGALHVAYHTDGPDGRPLRLLHRDIKPSNIMLTKHGKVVVLDFGSAWAKFAARESDTTDHIGGTPGYIPPERLDGTESPAGDVFSLGVVFYAFLTGDRPPPLLETAEAQPFEPPDDLPDEVIPILAFAHRMRAIHPRDRPTMEEVRRFCRDQQKAVQGPDLKVWCDANIPEYAPRSADGRVGRTLKAVEPEPKPFGIEKTLLLRLLVAMGALLLVAGVLLGALWSPLG